jgi:hypothetical protein
VEDSPGRQLEEPAARRPLPEVDETQIVENLKLTPDERLEVFLGSHENLRELLALVRRVES